MLRYCQLALVVWFCWHLFMASTKIIYNGQQSPLLAFYLIPEYLKMKVTNWFIFRCSDSHACNADHHCTNKMQGNGYDVVVDKSQIEMSRLLSGCDVTTSETSSSIYPKIESSEMIFVHQVKNNHHWGEGSLYGRSTAQMDRIWPNKNMFLFVCAT